MGECGQRRCVGLLRTWLGRSVAQRHTAEDRGGDKWHRKDVTIFNTMGCQNLRHHPRNVTAITTANAITGISFFCGAAVQRGTWPSHSRGYLITHNDASQSVGLLWTRYKCVADNSTWQNTSLTTDTQPTVDLRFRPRGDWDRPIIGVTT